MNLAALIESVPDWQSKTPEQLFASLSDPSVLVEDHDLYTWAGVAEVIGDVGASALCDALIAAGKLWAVHQFGGRGLDLANPEIQQQLYYLDSVGVPGMETLALHVRRQVSMLQQAGIETTVAEVAAALDQLTPQPDDVVAKQILLSVNSQIDGNLSASATVIEVTTRNGEVIRTSAPQVIVNGPLLDLVAPVVEALCNG